MSVPILLRIDIDFSFGLKKGVPYILDICEKYGVKGTFFSVMGPDTAASHGKRVLKKGYIKRIMSMNPLKMLLAFGPLLFLRGNLLPVQYVGKQYPEILKEIVKEGHELGLHGYNHAKWADKWQDMDVEEVRTEYDKANYEFKKIFGNECNLWGAPNWRTTEYLYQYLKERKCIYTSNLRGIGPFFPRYGTNKYTVMELPISLPALSELRQVGISKRKISKIMTQCLNPNYNHWVIHGYYEGILERKLFENTLKALLDAGGYFLTFKQFYDLRGGDIQQCDEIEKIQVPGGFGEISCQKSFIQNNYFDRLYCLNNTTLIKA